MKRSMLHFATLILIVAVTGSVAFAGGYQLNEHGARATALGGAFVARAADASAIYFNPAGLAFQRGMNVLIGASFILPSTTVLNKTGVPTETKMESQIFYPPNIYGTYEISEGLVAGIGVFTPFGLGSKYDRNWIGRYLSVETEVQTFYINPTLSYKITDDLSVGLGVSYILGNVTLSRRISPVNGNLSMEGSTTGIGFNAGVIYRPMKGMSIGASFRSLTEMEFEGDAVFTEMGPLATFFPGGAGKAMLPMPMNIQAGVSYDITSDVTAEVDFQYVGWSAYEKLTLNLPLGPAYPVTGLPLQGPSTEEKKWDDGMLFRAGIEYFYSADLTLRVGGLIDYAPQPASKMEPMLPDADRLDLTFGAGYKVASNMVVDFAYMVVLFQERNSTYTKFPASYNSIAHIFGFNFGYSF